MLSRHVSALCSRRLLSSYFNSVNNYPQLIETLSKKSVKFIDKADIAKIRYIIRNESLTEFDASVLLTTILRKRVNSIRPLLNEIEYLLETKEVYNPIAVSSLLFAVSSARLAWSEPTYMRMLPFIKENAKLLEHRELARLLYGVVKSPTTAMVQSSYLTSFVEDVLSRLTGFNGPDRGFLAFAYAKCVVAASSEVIEQLILATPFEDKPTDELGYIVKALGLYPLPGDLTYFEQIQNTVLQRTDFTKGMCIQLLDGFSNRGTGSVELYELLERTIDGQAHDLNSLRLVRTCLNKIGRDTQWLEAKIDACLEGLKLKNSFPNS